ncbi:hypothetical protein ABL78_2578 [Leptomonas seymouri]|uniref:Uncharacterized protein n=1 Tax=Leptomonas seymouri TaxID=5684 RepID=A0A0N0P738_LEPSE|nr:hypothetical protein ABL78_2578 [Leptomonas seymouri]|eukprot:KPI88339.1 hypothetical protein ABL78_2578 [Leptomonas seymouri]
MGSTLCMATPSTAVATGSSVKLTTYAGVPLHALVAYERAALGLPLDTETLQRHAVQHLRADTHRPSHPACSSLSSPLFSSVLLSIPPDEAQTPGTQKRGDHAEGVPLWLQEVAALWNASSEQRLGRSSGAAAGNASSGVLRAEQQAAWANGTAQQLHDFVSTQQFAAALQKARGTRRRRSQGAPPPPVFAKLMQSYGALSRTITGGALTSCNATAETSITAGMWCSLICDFLRRLPEPLMPQLCSRRLEPLLAQLDRSPVDEYHGSAPASSSSFSSTALYKAALKVLLDSFVSLSIVDYVTFGFILRLVNRHRAELTGGEVEALAHAILRESVVPHVLREVAHACKPEARMFRAAPKFSAASTPSTAGREATHVLHDSTMRQHDAAGASKASVQTEKASEQPAASPAAAPAHTGATGASAEHGSMTLPPVEGEESDSTWDDSLAARSKRSSNRIRQHESLIEPKENPAGNPGSLARRTDEVQNALNQLPTGNSRHKMKVSSTAHGTIQWHGTPSSSSVSDEEDDSHSSDNTALKTKHADKAAELGDRPSRQSLAVTANPARMATAASSPPSDQIIPPLLPQPGSSCSASTTVISTVKGAEKRTLHPSAATPIAADAALVDAPSLVGVSPVRRSELSLLSRYGRDGTAEEGGDMNIPSTLFSRNENDSERVIHEGEDASLPSALAIHPAPTPLRTSRSDSALYPSALEDPLPGVASAATQGPFMQTSGHLLSAAPMDRRPPTLSLGLESQGCPLGKLPSPSRAGALRTPRDLLQQQQLQAQEQQEHPETQRQGPACAAAGPPTKVVRYRAQESRPLQAALLEAKQRFIAASVRTPSCTFDTTARSTTAVRSPAADEVFAAWTDHASVTPDESAAAARMRCVLECAQENGWSSEDVLSALQKAQLVASAHEASRDMSRTQASSRLAGQPPRNDCRLPRDHAAKTGAEVAAHRSIPVPTCGGPPDSLSVNLSPAPEAELAWLPSGSNDRRVPENTVSRRDALSERHHLSAFSSASTLHLDHTRAFHRDSDLSTVMLDAAERQPRSGKANKSEMTVAGASLLTPSTNDDPFSISRSGDSPGAGSGAGHSRPSGSSLATPADVTFITTVNTATSGQSSTAGSSLISMKKELQRLRDAVRALEENHFVQTRAAAAQTAELMARCAELQRQQQEQEQQFRFTKSRLADVNHVLEDLKDDKARLQMQLTAARQDGVRLREVLLTGKALV